MSGSDQRRLPLPVLCRGGHRGVEHKVDRKWDTFWSGGISNPLKVIEQITYLIFIKRLDDLQTLEENKANRTGKPVARHIFPTGSDDHGRPNDRLRWSRFRHLAPDDMYEVVSERVFPFLRELGGDGSSYAQDMHDARSPSPALLARVVDLLDDPALTRADREAPGPASTCAGGIPEYPLHLKLPSVVRERVIARLIQSIEMVEKAPHGNQTLGDDVAVETLRLHRASSSKAASRSQSVSIRSSAACVAALAQAPGLDS